MDSLDRLFLFKRSEACVELHQSESIYFHHAGDVDVEYYRLIDSVTTACRSKPDCLVKGLLSFEEVNSTEWQPPRSAPAFQCNLFVDFSDEWECKREALEDYSSEMRYWTHVRFLEALERLARWRSAHVGVAPAEPFSLISQLV